MLGPRLKTRGVGNLGAGLTHSKINCHLNCWCQKNWHNSRFSHLKTAHLLNILWTTKLSFHLFTNWNLFRKQAAFFSYLPSSSYFELLSLWSSPTFPHHPLILQTFRHFAELSNMENSGERRELSWHTLHIFVSLILPLIIASSFSFQMPKRVMKQCSCKFLSSWLVNRPHHLTLVRILYEGTHSQ